MDQWIKPLWKASSLHAWSRNFSPILNDLKHPQTKDGGKDPERAFIDVASDFAF